jgi:hypothetical protein
VFRKWFDNLSLTKTYKINKMVRQINSASKRKYVKLDILHSLHVFIRQGKAYLPIMARTESSGPAYIITGPVITTELSVNELSAAMNQSYQAGNPVIKRPGPKEISRLPHPLTQAAKVRSWRKLFEGARSYGINWHKNEIKYSVGVKSQKHRGMEPDLTLNHSFPVGTPINEIAKYILDDVIKYPEVFEKPLK